MSKIVPNVIVTLPSETIMDAFARCGVREWKPEKAEPHPAWPIRRFAVWYLRHRPIQQSAIPIHGPVDAARPLVGVTLYREPPFQVQLFIGLPGASTPRHSHPNVDSIEWHVAGESGFVSERNASFAGLMHIAAGEMHTAQAGAAGAAFLSMQKWLNGVAPSSVELDWEMSR